MSKDFNLIMENWRNFSTTPSLIKEQGGGYSPYSKLVQEHYNNMINLIDQQGNLSDIQKQQLKKENEKSFAAAQEMSEVLNGSLNTFPAELESMLSSRKKPEKPIAAESLNLDLSGTDEDKTDPDIKAVGGEEGDGVPVEESGITVEELEFLKETFPNLTEHNENLLEMVIKIEAALKSEVKGQTKKKRGKQKRKKIKELAGRAANVVYSISKNEKPANSVYGARLRACYFVIAAVSAEGISFVLDKKAWVNTFITNHYTQYSAAFREFIGGITPTQASSLYDNLLKSGSDKIIGKMTGVIQNQGGEGSGWLAKIGWKIAKKYLKDPSTQAKLKDAANSGLEPMKAFIEKDPLLKRFFEDVAISEYYTSHGISMMPETTMEGIQNTMSALWAYIINAGTSAQVFFWTAVVMWITSIVYNWFTSDPQNVISMSYFALKEQVGQDLAKAKNAVKKIGGWIGISYDWLKGLFSGDKDKIEESLLRLKIILDKRALGVL